MKLVKAMFTVGSFTMLSRIAGFTRDILTAAILGAGPVADAFFVALKLPNFFRRAFAEGAFSYAFIPLYTEEREKNGAAQATQFFHNTMAVMTSFLVPFTLLFLWVMPWVIYGVAPGFNDDPVRYDLAVELTRVTFPYLACMSIVALLGGVLNVHNKFAPFAAAPVLFNLCLIIALLLSDHIAQTPGHAMAWGVLTAGIVQILWMLFNCRKAQIPVLIVRPKWTPRIKRLLKLMGPGLLGAGVTQLNLFIDIILASFLPVGAVSYLYYADRLNQLPLGVVGAAVGTALMPMLAQAIAAKNDEDTRSLFNRSLEIGLLLTLPAAAALLVVPDILITVMFERGAFGEASRIATAYTLMAYAIGLPAYVVVKVFNTSYFARLDTMSPVKVSVFVTACNIALSLALIQPLQHVGIALATGLTGWLHVLILGWKLHKTGQLNFDRRLYINSFKIALAVILMVVALLFAAPIIQTHFIAETHLVPRIIGLIILVLSGAAIYAGTILATGTISKSDLRLLKKKRTA